MNFIKLSGAPLKKKLSGAQLRLALVLFVEKKITV